MKQNVLKTSRRVILPVVLSMVMLIAMAVPAFADNPVVSHTAPTGSWTDISSVLSDDTIAQGSASSLNLTAPTGTHYEYYCEDNNDGITVNRQYGTVSVPTSAVVDDQVTIDVYQVNYSDTYSPNTPGPWYPVADDVIGYGTYTVTVTSGSSAYGWQGTDLQMKVTSPSDITLNTDFPSLASTNYADSVTANRSLGSYSYYANTTDYANNTLTTVSDVCAFTFQFNAGFNSSHGEFAFTHTANTDNNLNYVHVYHYDGTNLKGSAVTGATIIGGNNLAYNSNVSTFSLGVTGLSAGTYVLEFGSGIHNYNYGVVNSRTLGRSVDIIFTVS